MWQQVKAAYNAFQITRVEAPERDDGDLLGLARHCVTSSPKCFDANEQAE
jgi:hypothetical protein